MRRYLTILLCAAVFSVLAAGVFAFVGMRSGYTTFREVALYHNQRERIAAARELDALFIGDSSLWNAIDDELWSELSGRATLNLALSGNYGYAGSLNMLKHALVSHHPSQIFVVHTIEMPTRDVSSLGFAQTQDGLPVTLASALESAELYFNLHSVLTVAEAIVAGDRIEPQRVDGRLLHLFRQKPLDRIPLDTWIGDAKALDHAHTNPEKSAYLRQIAELCRSRGLRCLYAHGPILEPFCTEARSYIARATAFVEETGLRVAAGTPLCIPLEEIGNAPDHVGMALRREYTRRYFEILSPR